MPKPYRHLRAQMSAVAQAQAAAQAAALLAQGPEEPRLVGGDMAGRPPRRKRRTGSDRPGREHTVYILARTDPEWDRSIYRILANVFLFARQKLLYLCTYRQDSGDWMHATYDPTRVGIDANPMHAWPASSGWHPQMLQAGERFPSMLAVMDLPHVQEAQSLSHEEWAKLRRIRYEIQQSPPDVVHASYHSAPAAEYRRIAQLVRGGPQEDQPADETSFPDPSSFPRWGVYMEDMHQTGARRLFRSIDELKSAEAGWFLLGEMA